MHNSINFSANFLNKKMADYTFKNQTEEAKYQGSPDTRYMGSSGEEHEMSPYEKNLPLEEIKKRINQSLHEQKSDKSYNESLHESPSTNSPNKQIKQIKRSPNKNVLSQEIHDEFNLNNSYYRKMLQDANNVGTKNLITTSIKAGSPYKFDRADMPKRASPNLQKKPLTSKKKEFFQKNESNIPAGVPQASREILSQVFDGNLSVHSPSKNKQIIDNKTLTPNKSDLANEGRLGTTNSILERFAEMSSAKRNISPKKDNYAKNFLEEAYEAAIESDGKDMAEMSPEDQIIKFSGCINSMRKDIKLGGVVGVFVILNVYPRDISQSIIDHVLQITYTQLIHYESNETVFLVAILELIGFIGITEISVNSASIIRTILCTADSGSDLQLTAINTLVLLGYPGLQVLLEIASKDYQQLQQVILSRLCSIPFIQVYISQ